LDDFSYYIINFLNYLKINEYSLIGFSSGGLVAIQTSKILAKDEKFVKALAKKFKLPFHFFRIDKKIYDEPKFTKMILEQLSWTPSHKWQTKLLQTTDNLKPQVDFVFGSRKVLSDKELIKELQSRYPHSQLIGCSTSGEIAGTSVQDDTIVATAIEFQKSSRSNYF
jgi:hypothetical protein